MIPSQMFHPFSIVQSVDDDDDDVVFFLSLFKYFPITLNRLEHSTSARGVFLFY